MAGGGKTIAYFSECAIICKGSFALFTHGKRGHRQNDEWESALPDSRAVSGRGSWAAQGYERYERGNGVAQG